MGTFLRPEFLNRIDDIVVFNPINEVMLLSIVSVQLEQLTKLIAKEKDIHLHYSDQLKQYLAQLGYDPAFGVRPLKRAIQKHLLDRLAHAIINGTIKEGDTIIADVKEEQIIFKPQK
jgi:ATP-dependent Clp protease ATP-binding subunit ClpA